MNKFEKIGIGIGACGVLAFAGAIGYRHAAINALGHNNDPKFARYAQIANIKRDDARFTQDLRSELLTPSSKEYRERYAVSVREIDDKSQYIRLGGLGLLFAGGLFAGLSADAGVKK